MTKVGDHKRIAAAKVMLSHLAERPEIILEDHSYKCISQFLLGYLHGLSCDRSENLNLAFTKWLQAKHAKPSNYQWPKYVFIALGKSEDVVASEMLLRELVHYLTDWETSLK